MMVKLNYVGTRALWLIFHGSILSLGLAACGVKRGSQLDGSSRIGKHRNTGVVVPNVGEGDAKNSDKSPPNIEELGASQVAKPKVTSFKFGDDFVQMFLPPLNLIRGTKEYLFAVGSGSLFISSDAGLSWKISKAPSQISDILADVDRIYGLDANGLVVSTDNGKTWVSKTINQGVNINAGKLLAANGKIFVATNSGLYISTNKGETFSEVNVFKGQNCREIHHYNSKIWVLTDSAIIVSPDAGQTFTTVNSANIGTKIGARNTSFDQLAFDTNRVYAIKTVATRTVTGGVVDFKNVGRFWMSSDDGRQFSEQRSFPDQPSSLSNLFAQNGQIFIVADAGVLISNNNGLSWSRKSSEVTAEIRDNFYGTLESYAANSGGPDSGVRSIFVNSGKVYAATETGFSFSLDGGNVWQHRSTLPIRYNQWDYSRVEAYRTVPRLIRTNFWPLDIKKVVVSNENIFLQSTFGFFQSLDGGQTWEFKDRFTTHDLNFSGTSLICRTYDRREGNYGELYASTWSSDGGKTWTPAPDARGRSCLNENGQRVILDSFGEKVMVSGVSIAAPIASVLRMFSSEKMLFLLNGNSLALAPRESLRGTEVAWEVSRLPFEEDKDSVPRVFSVKETIFIATNTGLYSSRYKGKNWIRLTSKNGLGSDKIRAIVLVRDSILAATSAGVSVSIDGGESWRTSKPELDVTSLFVSKDKLYLSTVDNVYNVGLEFE